MHQEVERKIASYCTIGPSKPRKKLNDKHFCSMLLQNNWSLQDIYAQIWTEEDKEEFISVYGVDRPDDVFWYGRNITDTEWKILKKKTWIKYDYICCLLSFQPPYLKKLLQNP